MATTQSTPGQIEFLIKKYPGGRFSALLDDGLAVGDELSQTGPYGSSTLKDGHVLPVVCMAGGAGMAPHPVHPAAPEGDRQHPPGPVLLRRPDGGRPVLPRRDPGARSGLTDFEFVACLSESVEGAASAGRGRATSPTSSSGGRPSSQRSEVYLCGPPPMVDAASLLEASNRTEGPGLLRQVHQLQRLPMESEMADTKQTQFPEDRVHRLRGRRAGVPELEEPDLQLLQAGQAARDDVRGRHRRRAAGPERHLSQGWIYGFGDGPAAIRRSGRRRSRPTGTRSSTRTRNGTRPSTGTTRRSSARSTCACRTPSGPGRTTAGTPPG